MYDFEKKIEDFKKRYIYQVGEQKYSQLDFKVKNSKYLKKAIESSLNNNHPLGEGDFYVISNKIVRYISGATKAIMVQLLAFELWNSTCNRNFKYFSKYELSNMVSKMLGSYGKMGHLKQVSTLDKHITITQSEVRRINQDNGVNRKPNNKIKELEEEIQILQATIQKYIDKTEEQQLVIDNEKSFNLKCKLKYSEKNKLVKSLESKISNLEKENTSKNHDIRLKNNKIENLKWQHSREIESNTLYYKGVLNKYHLDNMVQERLFQLNSIYDGHMYLNTFSDLFLDNENLRVSENDEFVLHSYIGKNKTPCGETALDWYDNRFGFENHVFRYMSDKGEFADIPIYSLISCKNSKGIRFRDLLLARKDGQVEFVDIMLSKKDSQVEFVDIILPLYFKIIKIDDLKVNGEKIHPYYCYEQFQNKISKFKSSNELSNLLTDNNFFKNLIGSKLDNKYETETLSIKSYHLDFGFSVEERNYRKGSPEDYVLVHRYPINNCGNINSQIHQDLEYLKMTNGRVLKSGFGSATNWNYKLDF
ncbi:hypothetical protein [Lutimonas vermicola]|uniref:Uncharacterized protein n=1 Tax=Lutimonas vermicola TaxID=414288 RepID=A0ABU9L2N4_9FLAO